MLGLVYSYASEENISLPPDTYKDDMSGVPHMRFLVIHFLKIIIDMDVLVLMLGLVYVSLCALVILLSEFTSEYMFLAILSFN